MQFTTKVKVLKTTGLDFGFSFVVEDATDGQGDLSFDSKATLEATEDVVVHEGDILTVTFTV